ncbi:MAG: hypothetical protein ABR971_01775 [Acidobacteriaceae bacterium]|jgi:uncharacterized protein YjgD (DUF1641 family)
MAVAVDFRTYTPPDSRLDLVRRIESAPREHADAVLEAYDVLQRLHDTGTLALVSGLLSAENTVIDKVSDVVSSKQAITMLRIAMILGSALTSIDADRVHAAVAEAETRTPSLWTLLRAACSTEVRKAAGLGLSLAQIFGASLLANKSTGTAGPATGSH